MTAPRRRTIWLWGGAMALLAPFVFSLVQALRDLQRIGIDRRDFAVETVILEDLETRPTGPGAFRSASTAVATMSPPFESGSEGSERSTDPATESRARSSAGAEQPPAAASRVAAGAASMAPEPSGSARAQPAAPSPSTPATQPTRPRDRVVPDRVFQVGAFGTRMRAEALASELVAAGFDAFVAARAADPRVGSAKGVVHRVRVRMAAGPGLDRLRRMLRASGLGEVWEVRE